MERLRTFQLANQYAGQNAEQIAKEIKDAIAGKLATAYVVGAFEALSQVRQVISLATYLDHTQAERLRDEIDDYNSTPLTTTTNE